MNLTFQEATDLFETLSKAIIPRLDREVVVFLPQPFLGVFKSNDRITLGAQNFHAPELNGAFTGETSLNHLKSLQISTVLVGHSERRTHFGESNEMVMLKARKAADEGFQTVLCCGEPLEVRERGETDAVLYVYDQLKQLEDWPIEALQNVVIAYEPIWAIGTGLTPSLQDIVQLHLQIQIMIRAKTKFTIPIIYGGSCDAENSKEIFALKGVHGGLIGGASLNAVSFLQIISNAC